MYIRVSLLVASYLVAGAVFATSAISQPTEMIASPSSVYWTTLVTNTPRLTCAWPVGAHSATLRMTGGSLDRSQGFTRGATDVFLKIESPTLEAPSRFREECLYTLALTFDTGESFTSRLASVRGVCNLGTRVVATDDLTTAAWQRIPRRALIPIPMKGVETVALNGVETPANLNGECGWFEWTTMPLGVNTFVASGQTATFFCYQDGTWIIMR